MADDFKKDDFQKEEPIKPCISCEATDDFVMVRRPMQQQHVHRDSYQRQRGQHELRSLEGFNELHGKLLDNLFGRLSDPVNVFTQSVNNWKSLINSHHRSNEPWLLELDLLLGAKQAFFRRLVGAVFNEHLDEIQTLLKNNHSHRYSNASSAADQRSTTVQLLKGTKENIGNEIARIMGHPETQKTVSQVLSNGFRSNSGYNKTSGSPETKARVIETLTKAIEDEMEQYQVSETDWEANLAQNDPERVPRPRHLSNQIPADIFYEAVHHCPHCGAIQSRTFNIQCTIRPMQEEESQLTITYNGPTKDLYEHLKAQLDEIWAEPLAELDARIAKATKLLKTGEKRYNKRLAEAKEKARQEEIRALKKKLKALEDEK